MYTQQHDRADLQPYEANTQFKINIIHFTKLVTYIAHRVLRTPFNCVRQYSDTEKRLKREKEAKKMR